MKKNLKAILLLCALIAGSSCAWADTTFRLQQVTTVEDGSMYVFEQDGYVMSNSVNSSNVLLTTNTYSSTGLTGTESYVWKLESATGGYYMKNLSKDDKEYLNNTTSTSMSFGSKNSIWTFTFTDGVALIQNSSNGNRFLGYAAYQDHGYKAFEYTTNYLDICPHDITVYKLVEETAVPSSSASFTEKTPSIELPGETTYTQVPTTADGYTGEITYELTANTAGATINEEGTVTVTQEGSVTVTATAAAIDGQWLSSSDSYTLTVTDTRTTAPISFSSATAEAMMGEDFDEPTLTNPQNLTVTYVSNNEAVATVDATTGAVTLVAAGTANIIATFAGNTTYKYTTTQYELTVHKGAEALPYTESFDHTFGEFTSDGVEFGGITVWTSPEGFIKATSSINNVNKELESWLTSPVINAKDVTHIALSFDQAIDSYFGTIADEAVVYAKKVSDENWTKLTITYPSPSENSNPVYRTTTIDLSDYVGNNIQIAFFYKGTTTNAGTWRIKNLKVAVSAEDVTVSAAGLSTFASDNALDFTNVENLEAYIAKEDGENITLQQVNKVPAGTGVLLRAKNNATDFVVPFTTASTDDVTENIFHRGTGAAVATGSGPYNWILSTKNGVLGFYHANGNTVATNHAYLQTTSANARIDLTFGEETAIRDVNRQSAEGRSEVYDLQGRRVALPTPGLYIVNGKKAIIK